MRGQVFDRKNSLRSIPSALMGAVMGSILLVSCASVPSKSVSSGGAPGMDAASPVVAPSQAISTNPAADAAPEEVAQKVSQPSTSTTTAEVSRPQLIRRAELRVVVDSIPETMQTVNTLIRQQGGDVLSSSTQQPTNPNSHRTAVLAMRVPQERLDAVVERLAGLGIVERQVMTAEDVSTQLVDIDARLKNLRRTEETLLKIMDRSGSVGDVLKVAQELSNVRQGIEQIDAQLKALRSQVAFSSITLDLEEAVTAGTITPRSVPLQLGETWKDSTRSLKGFSVGVLRLMIWGLVYSPYLVGLVGVVWWLRRKRRQAPPTLPPSQISPEV